MMICTTVRIFFSHGLYLCRPFFFSSFFFLFFVSVLVCQLAVKVEKNSTKNCY